MNTFYITIPIIFALTACGGNGADGVANVDRIVVGAAVSDEVLQSRIGVLTDAYVDDYEAGNFASSVPVSGRASMSGAVLIGDPGIVDGTNLDTADVAGQIDISVDFATNEVDGIASNFHVIDGADFDGQLTLDATILRDTKAGIAGTMSGVLENAETGPSDLSFDIQGNFMGAGASGLVAGGTGRVIYDGDDIDALGLVFAAD